MSGGIGVARQAALTALLAVAVAGGAALAAPGGATAEAVVSGTAHESLFAISARGGHALAVGDMGVVLGSDDGCRSWQPQATPVDGIAMLDVYLGDRTAVAVGQGGMILVRDPSGGWERASSPTQARLLGVGGNAAGLIFAVGAFGAVVRSEDQGHSWSAVPIDWGQFVNDGFEPHLYDVAVAADGSVTIAGEFELILRSADRGATWTAAHRGRASLFSLSMDDAGQGYAVGQSGRVLHTDDGGRRWSLVAFDGDSILLNVWQQRDRVAVVGIRDFRWSDDRGATWSALHNEDIATNWYSGIAGCGGDDGWVIAGHSGRLVRISGE